MIAVLIISILHQFAAAVLALRLVRVSGRRTAWGLIAVAIALMAVRRCFTLQRIIAGDVTHPADLTAELVALGISVLMLVGIAMIAPLFSDLRRTVDKLEATSSQLQESEGRLQLAQQVAGIGTWAWDVRTNVTHFTDEQYRQFGLNPDDASLAFEGWLELVHPDDRQRCETAVRNALEGAEPLDIEYRVVLHDRTTIWLVGRPHVVRDTDGSPLRMVGVNIDITERKQAEIALRESEERYRRLVENSPFCIHELAMDGTFLSMNRAGLQMMGRSDESQICGVPYLSAVRNQDKPAIAELLDQAREGRLSTFEFETQNGQTFDSCFVPLADTDGKTSKIMGITQDISERRRAEQALADTEQRLHQLAENVDEVFWVVAADLSEVFYVNPAYERIWGRTRESLHANPRSFLEAVHDEDKPKLMAAVGRRSSGETNEATAVEYRIVRPDGGVRWIRSRQTSVTGVDGTHAHMVGVAEDVTERKQAEQALRESEERFRSVFNQQFQFMAILSPEGLVLDVNRLVLQVQGASREDFVGKRFWESPAWRDLPEWKEIIRDRIAQAFDLDGPLITEDQYQFMDGTVRFADAA
ncbi:MAG: PAS domain S-box protein [Planctomycetota bacterium]|nr:PAS domain S-box protein [Planctomycetota bacterium]